MTLVLVAANADQIIQVSDRRLTWGEKLVDDSASKAGHGICDDASFLFSFTGVARAGVNHVTSRWLPEALYDAAQRSHRYRDIWDALADEAGRYFRVSPDLQSISSSARRLTIMLTGYTADGFIVSALISNFQDFTNFIDYPEARQDFTVFAERSITAVTENPTVIQVIGQFGAFTAQDENQLRQMLVERCPAEAIRQKAISLVQEIADRPSTRGTVGKKVNTARLSSAEPQVPVAGYASDVIENRMHLLDQVNLRTGVPKTIVADIQISVPTPVIFPRVHRNAPCPCGSGKKYRLCHGDAHRGNR